MATKKSQYSTNTAGGFIVPRLARRNVRMYAITDVEIASLSARGIQRTAFFSIGSALLSLAVAIWLGVEIEGEGSVESLTPRIQVLYSYGVKLLIVVGLIFYGLGIGAWHRATSVITGIKESSTWEREET